MKSNILVSNAIQTLKEEIQKPNNEAPKAENQLASNTIKVTKKDNQTEFASNDLNKLIDSMPFIGKF